MSSLKKKVFSVTGTVLPPYPKWKNVTSIKPFSLMVGTNSKRSNFMSILKEICCSLKKKLYEEIFSVLLYQ